MQTAAMNVVMVHDRQRLEDRLTPAIAQSFQRRSFEPLKRLARELAPSLEQLGRRFHLTADEQPLFARCGDLRFDRRTWRHLAGECLFYTAEETCEFPIAEELLARFVSPTLVERLIRGSREILFAGVPYRPISAGLHDRADLAEIVDRLGSIDDRVWTEEPLVHVPPDERADELALARQGFAELRRLFESAYDRDCVIVCEEL
jgi:hypothetical protein